MTAFTSAFRLLTRSYAVQLSTASRASRMSSGAVHGLLATEGMQTVEEGSAKVFVPSDVFYNPVQVFNRDLTMAVLNVFGKQYMAELAARRAVRAAAQQQQQQSEQPHPPPQESAPHYLQAPVGLRILEALAATGLRSIRIAKEVPGVAKVVANDNSAEAARLIEANAESNGVLGLVEVSHNDAVMLCHQCAKIDSTRDDRFDVIDLDPYGSAVPFLDSAVQAVRPGGLLCVTCTDTAVLCGSASGTCYGRYGATPYRGAAMHEAALRVLLQCVQSHASRHSRYIEPLLSLSVDFYVRVYMRVHRGPGEVKRIAKRLAMLHSCPLCDTHSMQPLVELVADRVGQSLVRPAHLSGDWTDGHCGQCGIGRPQLSGPFWSDPIHSAEFVRRLVDFVRSDSGKVLASAERLTGILSVVAEELPDIPLYYSLDDMARAVKCRTMPMRLARSALLNAGYRVSISHCDSNVLKTDAPAAFLWDMVRAYKEQFNVPVSERHLAEGSLPRALLVDRRPAAGRCQVDFTLHPQAEPPSKTDGLLRFHVPPPNWGPKPRAKRAANAASDDEEVLSPASDDGEAAKKCKESVADTNDAGLTAT